MRMWLRSAFSISFFVRDESPLKPVFLLADNMFGVTGILLMSGSGFSKNLAKSVRLQHFAISIGDLWNLFVHVVEAPSRNRISARMIRSWSNRPSSHQASPHVCSRPSLSSWSISFDAVCLIRGEVIFLLRVNNANKTGHTPSLLPISRSPAWPRRAYFAKTFPYRLPLWTVSPAAAACPLVSWQWVRGWAWSDCRDAI